MFEIGGSMYFNEFKLDNDILYALDAMNFKEATPIQEVAIPVILSGRDVLGCAQTGTGKTAAFLLPIMHRILTEGYPNDKVNCVIMVPTRELAVQIEQQVEAFGYFLNLSALAIYGGTDGITFEQQKKALQLGTDIVVATPGRLLSMIRLQEGNIDNVGFFVLDEADRMLDMGFAEDIAEIIKIIPENSQRLLFSATMPDKIKKLAKTILKNPKLIELEISKPPESILQFAYNCYDSQKILILKEILTEDNRKRTIIFTSSKSIASLVTRELTKDGLSVKEMHSDLPQEERESVLRQFKSNTIDIIIATDIMARGIDIDNVRIVINYDVPRDAEDYVHRIGRTARGSNSGGLAITLINEKEQNKFADIERLLSKTIKKLPLSEDLGPAPIYQPTNKTKSSYKKSDKSKARNKALQKQTTKQTL